MSGTGSTARASGMSSAIHAPTGRGGPGLEERVATKRAHRHHGRVTRRRLTDVLVLLLGGLYLSAGVAETIRVVRSGDGGLAFWFGTLVGGGSMVLLGQ